MSVDPNVPKPPPGIALHEHDALPAGTRFGEFEIIRALGVGGFGIVYLAQDHSLERPVALKEYMPAALAARGDGAMITVRSSRHAETYAIGLRSFVNEARLLARFDHPSLVKVYRFWEDNGTAYMVMPYMPGRTLRDARIAMSAAPDETWIRGVLDPMLDALELLHREGVFHRDIAPDNVLLNAEGRPVLLDFGAARRVISDRTQSLTAILKPSYAPIEQYAEMATMRQGPWTDVYALGAVLHYLLFGVPPAPATARAVQPDAEPIGLRSVPGVSPRFVSVVAWMLGVRPVDRPQGMAAVRAALDGWLPVPMPVRHEMTTLAMPHAPARVEPALPARAPPRARQIANGADEIERGRDEAADGKPGVAGVVQPLRAEPGFGPTALATVAMPRGSAAAVTPGLAQPLARPGAGAAAGGAPLRSTPPGIAPPAFVPPQRPPVALAPPVSQGLSPSVDRPIPGDGSMPPASRQSPAWNAPAAPASARALVPAVPWANVKGLQAAASAALMGLLPAFIWRRRVLAGLLTATVLAAAVLWQFVGLLARPRPAMATVARTAVRPAHVPVAAASVAPIVGTPVQAAVAPVPTLVAPVVMAPPPAMPAPASAAVVPLPDSVAAAASAATGTRPEAIAATHIASVANAPAAVPSTAVRKPRRASSIRPPVKAFQTDRYDAARSKGARDVCSGRNFIGLALCLERVCNRPRFNSDPDCVRIFEARRRRGGTY